MTVQQSESGLSQFSPQCEDSAPVVLAELPQCGAPPSWDTGQVRRGGALDSLLPVAFSLEDSDFCQVPNMEVHWVEDPVYRT